MSPIPSPTPLRRAVARILFSPAGLLFGFVVLLIATCPNARGDSSFGALLALGGGSSSTDLARLDVPVAPATATSARAAKPFRSSWRSPTPAERGERYPTSSEASEGPLAAVPLLTDPLLEGKATPPTAHISPMTGPTVGIRPKLPTGLR